MGEITNYIYIDIKCGEGWCLAEHIGIISITVSIMY